MMLILQIHFFPDSFLKTSYTRAPLGNPSSSHTQLYNKDVNRPSSQIGGGIKAQRCKISGIKFPRLLG